MGTVHEGDSWVKISWCIPSYTEYSNACRGLILVAGELNEEFRHKTEASILVDMICFVEENEA